MSNHRRAVARTTRGDGRAGRRDRGSIDPCYRALVLLATYGTLRFDQLFGQQRKEPDVEPNRAGAARAGGVRDRGYITQAGSIYGT